VELIKKNNLKEFKNLVIKSYYNRVLIVSGKKSFHLSGAKKIIKKIFEKVKKSFYFKKSNLPEVNELKDLIILINNFKPNLIIAIGGGGVMDLAKIANAMYSQNNIKQCIIKNDYDLKNNYCDLISIPTTAGSGAEVTTNAVIYVDKKKFSIEGNNIKPTHSILMPNLIITNTRKIISSSAFDCLSQSIESMISVKSNIQSINYSKKSIKLFLENYKDFIKKKSLNQFYKISLAAYFSGKAISITKTTAPHAVSYPFTSYFGIHHGHAVSLTLNEFLEFNYKNFSKSNTKFNLLSRYQLLFKIFKVKNINELVKKIDKIKFNLKVINDLNFLNKNVDKNLNLIVKNVNVQRLTNNPVKVKSIDIYNILKNKIIQNQ
jgi:alcohol dehydrogenase class IV